MGFIFNQAEIEINNSTLDLASGNFYAHLVTTAPAVTATVTGELIVPNIVNYTYKPLSDLDYVPNLKWSFSNVTWPTLIYNTAPVGVVICKQINATPGSLDRVICFNETSQTLATGTYSLTQYFILTGIIQLAVDHYASNVALNILFEGSDNSTSFIDIKGNSVLVRDGAPVIKTSRSLYGRGSLFFNGSSSLKVLQSNTFAATTQDFSLEFILYPTMINASGIQGLFDTRASVSDNPHIVFINNNNSVKGLITNRTSINSNNVNSIVGLKANEWQKLSICRYQGYTTIYINDIPVASESDTTNYTALGDLIIGDILDTTAPFDGRFVGYLQSIRLTVGVARLTSQYSNSNLSNGDKGDITLTNNGSTWTIDDSSVTLNKIQTVASNTLLGRYSTGTGVVQSIAIGNNLQLLGNTLVGITNLIPSDVRDSLQSLTGVSRLDALYIKNLPTGTYNTPVDVRDALQTLTGTSRLDASAIQNLPAAGAQGVPGSPYNPRGTYSSGSTYARYDYVTFSGSSYFWASVTTGNTQPPSADWQLVASIGATGSGGGLSAWIDVVYSSYYVPAAGGRFSINASVGNVSIQLPTTPPANTEFTYQVIDTTANSVYIIPGVSDALADQATGIVGKHTSTIRSLIETLRYVGGKWLPYYGRLVYQAAIAAIVLPPETVFFAMFEGADNSTTFTDLRANPISVRSGTPKISTAVSLFGNGALYLDGLSSLTVPAHPSFIPGTQDFEWEIALYPTSFIVNRLQGIIDHRVAVTDSSLTITISDTIAGRPQFFRGDGVTVVGAAPLKLNQWQVLRIGRYQGIETIYLDDIPTLTSLSNANITNAGNLIIGDILNAIAPNEGMFIGYIQYVRHIVSVSRSQGYGTDSLTFARPPLTDADPLDAFKVLDINCDTGVVVDTKGHAITPTGAVAVSGIQKRAGSHSIALTGGYLDVAGGADFNFSTAPFSLHLSARPSAIGLGGGNGYPDNIYFNNFDTGGNSSIFYSSNAPAPMITIVGSGNTFVNTPVVNNWIELGLIKVDTKYLLLHNNQIVAASNNAPATANYATMQVGGYGGGSAQNLQGFMDSVLVYKGIANGSNLTHAYPLRFLARFSGNSLNDELGAVGTVVGTAPTYDMVNKRSLDASALFVGTGSIAYSAIQLGSGGFEIAGWIKADLVQNSVTGILSIGTTGGVFDSQSLILNNNADGFSSITGRSTTNKLSVVIGAINTDNAVLCSSTNINDGLPHIWRLIKYVIGVSGATVLIVDGKIEDVYIGAYTVDATTRPTTVGSDNVVEATRRFKGNLDDIAIYIQ